MQKTDAKWIWNANTNFDAHQYAVFRKEFTIKGRSAALHITADSRYQLYLNGEYLGFGPLRAYPDHYKKDVYELGGLLKKGKNVLSVLVEHFGCDTFQYLKRDGGLLAWLESEGETVLVSDRSWKADAAREYAANVPRISCQQGYEEQVDARAYCGWKEIVCRKKMPSALELRPYDDGLHKELQERDIPFLTRTPVYPARLVETERIVGKNAQVCLDYRKILPRDGFDCTPWKISAGLLFRVRARKAHAAELRYCEWYREEMLVNGAPADNGKFFFRRGENWIFLREEGTRHSSVVGFSLSGEGGLAVENAYLVGPFAPDEKMTGDFAHYKTVAGETIGTAEKESIFQNAARGCLDKIPERFLVDLTSDLIPENVFLKCYREPAEPCFGVQERQYLSERLTAGNSAALQTGGEEIRLLFDFGTELVGFLCLDITAEAGAVFDFHNFEFIQPDGRKNFAEGMNNTCRYTAKAGRQTFRFAVRRGLRYCYVTVRGCESAVFHKLYVERCSYPQTGRGDFLCSDWKLNRIYEVGKNTLVNCAEDTFTDCPTYEQAHWVGDMRNEALVHFMMSGDKVLWLRCLKQVGESLEYSDITLSQVPSGWFNVLPCWTFLWMRSVCEYYRYTGDRKGAKELVPFLLKNFEGIRKHVNDDGLFQMFAWNMFDWAAMDTPCDGAVTHLNCFAVLALSETAAFLQEFGEPRAAQCRTLADSINAAINRLLWDENRRAYADCLQYRGGKRVLSGVFSQQTQTVAFMSGAAQGERKERCRALMEAPEEGFVRAGSPFFEFFYLEAMMRRGDDAAFIGDLTRSWGKMIDTGCDTFWEMWTYAAPDGRLTRSHCHGWSAAPVYFLAEYVLGVTPVEAGYKKVRIRPHACGLEWCRGAVPTPYGDIHVRWEMVSGEMRLTCSVPEGVEIEY